MNLHTFEKSQQNLSGDQNEQGRTSSSFEHHDIVSIKEKIEKRKSKQKKVKIIFYTLIGLVVLFAVLFFYSQYKLHTLTQEESGGVMQQSVSSSLLATASSTPKTGEEVIQALRRHIMLPSGNPQIAEVQDVEKLRAKQAFFKNAQNGDIVVVYDTMIFLYRPSLDVVVSAGDISAIGETKP